MSPSLTPAQSRRFRNARRGADAPRDTGGAGLTLLPGKTVTYDFTVCVRVTRVNQ